MIAKLSSCVAAAVLTACTGIIDEPPVETGHTAVDPWDELDRIQREGPPRYTSRVHGCPKMRYATLGSLIASRGVNLAAPGPVSAGRIWSTGRAALAASNYAARIRENVDLGLATASKVFDIYVQAAPEIIANLPLRPACQIAGVGAVLFDAAGRCDADGISCLIGVPATQQHLDICNQTIARASDAATGKQLAVAVLAAAAHTCE